MDSALLYQQDGSILEFEAQVVEERSLPGGKTAVLLDRSYFYPTGGGQEHDTGTLGSARVIDVYKDESTGVLVHVVEGQPGLGALHAHIDAERRLRHMQHHSAQHLLTQCLLRVSGYETVSANINGYSPSTLDIIAPEISKASLDQAELMANQLIYDNLRVKTYFVSPVELTSIPLRRPPKVTENIRIVEIDGFDYSPCGGTHVQHTGSIGLLKVLKVERQNDKLRIHFIAGLQAMAHYRQLFEAFNGLASQLSTGWQELPALFTHQAEQLARLQKDVQALRQESLTNEALRLAASAQERGSFRLVKEGFENRPVAELRLLAEQFTGMPRMVAFLASHDGQKLSLIVTCGEGSGRDAAQLLRNSLASLNGRGGGDARLAQGGGTATLEQFQAFLEQVEPG